MYMAPDSWKPLWNSLLSQARDGTVPMARLDDAVAKILRVKLRAGLFDIGKPSSRPFSGKFELLGSADHRAIAREAVRKSLVLLKNEGGLLPLKPGGRILVAGDGANDVARQSGGWTLTWQGTGIDPKHFPGATSLWRGISDAAESAGGSATLSLDGSFTGVKPDAAIVVFGETPYAEFQGDLTTLQLKPEQRRPLETMRRLKAQGIPVVALMLTGRPLWTNPELNVADAFVVAWLPGSEGQGVADVLLRDKAGKVAHDFTGRLSFAWPATAAAQGPWLFERGYGMSSADRRRFARLSEDSGVEEATGGVGVYMEKGLPASSWSLQVTDGAGAITRITTLPAIAANGRVQVTATDAGVQEGARKFAFDGSGGAMVELANQAPIDVTRETNGDVLLIATMRIDSPAPATIGIRTGPARAELPLPEMAQGKWIRLGVPLKCFAGRGANMAVVDAPFQLTSSGKLAFSLARVALGTDADQRISCP
jgi:beta-glucosidase